MRPRPIRMLHNDSAMLDREICCLYRDDRSNFKKLLFRREWPQFYAFDLLTVDGEDTCRLFPVARAQAPALMPTIDCRLLYLDHIASAAAGRG
jgi:hypothetical protein